MCQPVNPGGVACYGFTIQEKRNNRFYQIYEEGGIAFEPFSKESSNNVAEYIALIKLLEWLLAKGYNKFSGLANKAYTDFIDNNYAGLYNKLKPYFATDQQIKLLRHLKIKPSKYLSRIEANRYLKKYNDKK